MKIRERIMRSFSEVDLSLFSVHITKSIFSHIGHIVIRFIFFSSAGVGRTGTYIVLDRLMQTLNSPDFSWEMKIDLFDMVIGMRHNRTNMIQTEVGGQIVSENTTSPASDATIHCWLWFQNNYYALRKHAYSTILKNSPPKRKVFIWKFWYFSYFCSDHRLWVLVRTALLRQF